MLAGAGHRAAGLIEALNGKATYPCSCDPRQQRWRNMSKLWKRYLHLLDQDLNTKVFDNIKNLLVCALLFAAGSNALNGNHQIFMGLWGSQMTGLGLIVVSALLMLMNISDGLHRLAKMRYHVLLQVFFCLLYLIVAVRVVEIVWSFRAD
jgi:hypothetical protein